MQKLIYSPPALIAYSIFFLLSLYLFLPRFNLLLFPYNYIGLVISVMGLVLMGQARKLFKKHKTPLKLDRSSYLITEGVFSKSRNPIYLGMTVLILGLSILSTNIIALLVPLAFFGLVKWIFVIKEEKSMYDTFGQEYLNYKKTVRRWI